MIKTLICAMVLGFVFSKLNLEIPCPPNLLGIIGIIGVFLGYKLQDLL